MLSLPLAVILSLLGVVLDSAKTAGKIGLMLGLLNVLVFLGVPLFASIFC